MEIAVCIFSTLFDGFLVVNLKLFIIEEEFTAYRTYIYLFSGHSSSTGREVFGFDGIPLLPIFQIWALYHQTADNSMKQKNCPFDSPGQNFAFLEAADVVFVSELVDLGSKCAFSPPM